MFVLLLLMTEYTQNKIELFRELDQISRLVKVKRFEYFLVVEQGC